MYTTIKIKCDDQVLSFTEKPKIASGGVNEDKIKFTFDDKWTGFTKKANFYRNSNAIYTADIDQNNECIIPAIVLETSGTIYVSVYGEKDGSYRTTNVVKFKVIQGAKTNAPDPLNAYKIEWENEVKGDLTAALTHSATESELSPMPAYNDMTFAELVNEVEDTLMLTDENKSHLALYNSFITSVNEGNTKIWTVSRKGGLPQNKGYVRFPWINTSAVDVFGSDGFINVGDAVKEMGCDLTSSINLISGNSFINSGKQVEVVTLTGFDFSKKTLSIHNTYKVFFNGGYGQEPIIKYLYVDTIAIPQGDNSLENMFKNCKQLLKIGGAANVNGKVVYDDELYGFIDFSRVTNANNMFWDYIQEFKVKPKTLDCNFSIANAPSVNKKTVLSIINGFANGSEHTFSVHLAERVPMTDTWFCRLNETTNLYEECNSTDLGAMTFEDAIITKGWDLG